MRRRTILRGPCCLLALAGAVACADDGKGGVVAPRPRPAMLRMILSTPRVDDGALLLRIDLADGAVLDSVQRTAIASQVAPGAPGAPLRVLAVGPLEDGSMVAKLWLRDSSKAAGVTVTVEQVAARRTYVQRPPEDYRITLRP